MALATRPKPTVHHKKRQAEHHRHSKGYLSTYWPYLPMLAIVAVGVAVNNALYGTTLGSVNVLTASGPTASTRIGALTNQSNSIWLAVLAVSAVAFSIFVFRHWYRAHRWFSRGETFVSRHPWFDIVTVFVFTAGFVITRSNVIG